MDESCVFGTDCDDLADDAVGSKGVSVEGSTGNVGSSTEAEVKQVENFGAKVGNPGEAAVDKVGYRNGGSKTMAAGRKEKYDDLYESESGLAPLENQDSQAWNLGLVVEPSEGSKISMSMDGSGSVNNQCENQINSNAIEISEGNHGSQERAIDPVVFALNDLRFVDKDEAEADKMKVVTAEPEFPSSTFLALNLELDPNTEEEETLEEEVMTAFVSDVPESNQVESAVIQDVQTMVVQVTKVDPVQTTDCYLVLEEKNDEGLFESDLDGVVHNPVGLHKHYDSSGLCCENMQPGAETKASVVTEYCSDSNARAPLTKTESCDTQAIEVVSSSPLQGTDSQHMEDEVLDQDSARCVIDNARSGSSSTHNAVIEMEQSFQGDDNLAETEDSREGSEAAKSFSRTVDVKFQPEVDVCNCFASGGKYGDSVAVACRTEQYLVGFNVNSEGSVNTSLEIENLIIRENQSDCVADCRKENLFLQGNEASGNSQTNSISEFNVEGIESSMIHGEEVKTEKKPFNFLVRIPRFEDDSLREQITLTELLVDEKAKIRDTIRVQILEKRANSQGHCVDYEYAKGESKIARKLVRSKRKEIDSLHPLINKAKNALSVEDIDSQIYKMEHMMQHETLSSKEEKQLLRDIKQLKQLRVQLSSNMGSQDEISEVLEQRKQLEERLKKLRKELDVLKDRLLKSEVEALEAKKKYDIEHNKVKELQAQFRDADSICQAAYAQLKSLRKELFEKNKHFFKYKDDAAVANKYAFTQDREFLYSLCTDQVNNFMELWNMNEEFRKEYVRFNAESTVRRLVTLDDCIPGSDRNPCILLSYLDERVSHMISTPVNVDVASRIPILELKQETTIQNVTADSGSMKQLMDNQNHTVIVKDPPRMAVVGNDLDNVFVMDRDFVDEMHEEPLKSVAEVVADEIREEEAEAKLKEQRRYEAIAKANEARERKRLQAEKLQMRAEFKTQKEAEHKEKEREKRLRKRERKKVASPEKSEVSCESCLETSNKEDDMAGKRGGQKAQSKSKTPVPPGQRNRNKKKVQQWMCVAVTSIVIFFLFWLGNMGALSNLNHSRRNPIY